MKRRFGQRSRHIPEIPTASLPDIIFLLLIFFMVSSVLRQNVPQVQTSLPTAEAVATIDQKRLVTHVFIGPLRSTTGAPGPTAVQIDNVLVPDVAMIRSIMAQKLSAQPRLIVSLLVDEQAEMGVVADVQQELQHAGALRINYATRQRTQNPGP